MNKYFTLLDFSCMPTMSHQMVGAVLVGIIVTIVAAILAMAMYPNRREAVAKVVLSVGISMLLILIALFAYMTSFKCSVILTDGSKQTEMQVMTYRYPELGMMTVIIPRDNDLPLMNKYYTSRIKSR